MPTDASAPPRPLPAPISTPASAASPLPSPGATAPLLADGTTLTLQTTLFGPLAVPNGAARAAEIEELSRRAYRAAWRQFDAWCRTLGREPLAADPDTIAMYVVRCADQGFAVSSKGVRPCRQAAPAVPGVLRLMIAGRPAAHTPLGARERAMLVGFGAALRRSELVALTLGDVETVPGRGLRLLRPTSRARVRTSPSGPTRRKKVSARWQRSTPGSCTGAPPRTSTGPQPPSRAPNARCSAPSPKPAG